ncbi:Exonuclease SbcC [Labilithrix luteola]|uniref:Exonuclease SbcC n=2 Tax=Labilithrix luteola TaxID=1391654 RepID=A0A0K1Q7W5_9BACT|nr:Exonuclease SbcC [Labilithrix luteola]
MGPESETGDEELDIEMELVSDDEVLSDVAAAPVRRPVPPPPPVPRRPPAVPSAPAPSLSHAPSSPAPALPHSQLPPILPPPSVPVSAAADAPDEVAPSGSIDVPMSLSSAVSLSNASEESEANVAALDAGEEASDEKPPVSFAPARVPAFAPSFSAREDDDETPPPSIPAPPSPGLISGASQLPPAPIETIEAIAAAVGRLRGEIDATMDKARRARLLHEAGEIQERAGEEPGAARDYLAAYNADTSFREPLEGLVRVLERRRSVSNLGKLVEALVAAASTPDERARALTERALFFDDVQKDLEGARGAAREATETGAKPADLGAAWLTLELAAAKLGDAAQREEALAGRAELTIDPTWRGLLLVDVASLAAATGEITRALDIAARARSDGGEAAWLAAVTAERIVRADPGLKGSDEAHERAKSLAEVLEARADMIEASVDAAERGDALGVPSHLRQHAFAADALLSAAHAWRSANESSRAALALDRTLAVLDRARSAPSDPDSERAVAERKAAIAIERVALNTRVRLAESTGDTALASSLALRRMEGEQDGGLVASLALRVAEHAASQGDVGSALDALGKATERDPLCAPARALKIDILEGSDQAARFALELEDLSTHCGTGDAQGRALLLAAYVWAARAHDSERARTALGQAAACGVGKELVARLGRSLASVRSDDAWYEDATRSLIECREKDQGADRPTDAASELPMLWVEIARLRLAQGDEAGASKATRTLRKLAEGAWLGRVLDGFTADGGDAEVAKDARTAVEELTESTTDPTMRRSLSLVCALRAHAAGDTSATIAHLKTLVEADASDPLVASYLGDLLRAAGDRAGAAHLATALAEASDADDELRAARYLEAGFELWKLGDRSAAFASFEAASAARADAGEPVLAWAARGIDVDAVEGRRRAVERAMGSAATSLERFALEATLGDPDVAERALADVDAAPNPNLRLAGALARLAWNRGQSDVDALHRALEAIAETGAAGSHAAAAEGLLLSRVHAAAPGDDDVVAAAKAWLDTGGGAAAAMEWFAAAMASGDPAKEVPARRAIADLLSDEAREAMHASATLLDAVLRPEETLPLVNGTSPAARLANLELSPPGCDPRRRASTLAALDGVLGEESDVAALGLAGWSCLAAGDNKLALDTFRKVTEHRPGDLQAWEGLRTAADRVGEGDTYALACEQLGARCASDARGAAFWEQAALMWLKLGDGYGERAEVALDASFARDATREVAFDRLFRRVRDRKDGDKLLALVGRRLEVSDDPVEIAKMYWEMARVLREKGDPDGALEALEHVTMFDENHVGALALTGEIFIRRGMFAEAAAKLAHLARVESAPSKNRITAGIAAVDLYENKLAQYDRALEVLLSLHNAKLSTLLVRERLARAAARTGSWVDAARILEELMNERPEKAGRIEAARLAIAIYRDRLSVPERGLAAATKLVDESPAEGDALDLLINLDPKIPSRTGLLERGRDALLMALHETPGNLEQSARLARVARAIDDTALEQSALSCSLALSGPDHNSEQAFAQLSSRKPRVPHVALTEPMFKQILAPGDDGPVAELFAALGPTLAEALGPSLAALGVHPKKDRIDPRSGLALRNEIATWAGAFGIANFDLYVGGKDTTAVQGIPGETPAIVVGSAVNAPLSPTSRARVARELLAIVRGTTVTRWRDDTTIAAIVVAACNIAKVHVEHPPFAVLAEVERVIGKAISRKTKAVIEPLCRAVVQSNADARVWAARARVSQGRVAALASGDVAVVLADVFGETPPRLGAIARDDLRGHDLLRFVLSRPYFDLRRALGLEG